MERIIMTNPLEQLQYVNTAHLLELIPLAFIAVSSLQEDYNIHYSLITPADKLALDGLIQIIYEYSAPHNQERLAAIVKRLYA